MDMTNVRDITGDVGAVFAVVGAMAGWLPYVAALFTIVWTGIRIYETNTVQTMLGKKKGPED